MQEGRRRRPGRSRPRRRSPRPARRPAPRRASPASWSGSPNSPRPRPLQVKTSAPAGRRPPSASRRSPSASRRSRSAEPASRACSRTTVPGSIAAPTDTVPASGSAPIRPRTRKPSLGGSPSPASPPSSTMPSSRPLAIIARSDGASPSIASRSAGSAGAAAELADRVPVAAVTVSSGPTGAAPCETHGSSSTPLEPHADRPAVDDLVVDEQRGAALGGPRAGQAAEDRDAGRAGAQLGRGPARWGSRRGRGSRTAPVAPSRSGRPVTATASGPSTVCGVEGARRSPLAERWRPRPRRRCRPRPRARRPARRPRRSRPARGGASASCTPSSVASGALRCAPRAERAHDVGAAAAQRRARAWAPGLDRGQPGIGLRREPACRCARSSACDDTPRGDRSRAVARAGGLRPDRRRQDRASRSRSPTACATRGARPVAVSADALQVYRGLETLTGRRDAAERAALEHRLVSFLAGRRGASAPGEYARLAHAEIDGLLAAGRDADRRRRHRACTCAPRSPTSTCARRRPPALRARWEAELAAARPARRCTQRLAARRAVGGAASIAADRRQPHRPRPRAAGARRARARPRARAGCGPARPATRPAWSG